MIRATLAWLADYFRPQDEENEEADDSRFIPSVLDASVRYAHGMGNSDAQREFAQIEEQAKQLEEQHRDK